MMWDTQRELGPRVQKGFTDAQANARWILATLEEIVSLEGADDLGLSHKAQRAENIQLMEDINKMLVEDFVQGLVDWLNEQGESRPSWGPYFLFKHHPMACGLLSQDKIFHLQSLSTIMAGAQGMIMSAAHLYNAASKTGLLPVDLKWKDMEWIIEAQGEEHLFVGKRPEKSKDFRTHFNLAFGSGATEFAKDQRKPRKLDRHIWKKGKNRSLISMSKYMDVALCLTNKMFENTRAAEDGGALIECLLSNHLENKKSNYLANKRVRRTKPSAKGSLTTTNMTPVEMLTTLRDILEKDELPLRFDVGKLYLGCLKMLRSIQSHVILQAPVDYPPAEYTRGLAVNTVVSTLLWEVEGLPIEDEPQFWSTVQILRSFIEKHSDEELQKALSRVPPRTTGNEFVIVEKEPSFECPPEDIISILNREGYKGRRVIVHANGVMRLCRFDQVI